MKKIYLLLAVMIAAIIVAAVFLFGNSFRTVNYTSDLAAHLAGAVKAGTLRVAYGAQEKPLTDADVDGVLRVLRRGASEIQSVRGAPETYDGKIILYSGDLTLTMYQMDKNVDSVIMDRLTGGKHVYYQLDGYAMFKWFLDAVGIEEA